jgi:hypothetical protein
VAALVSPLAVALAGRRLARWRILTIVLASQLLFHVAFATTASADPGPIESHAHGAHVALAADAVTATLDPVMAFGHVLAALLTSLALFHGERMLRALGRGILRLLPRPGHASLVVDAPPRVVAPVAPVHVRQPFASAVRRRGPPALSH